MNDLEFYENWYDKEEQRRTSLENSLNIPIGILTVNFILQFYLIKEFDFKISTLYEEIFLISAVVFSFIAALVATYYLLKSYHRIYKGFEYKGLPYPSELLEYKNQLKKYYQDFAINYPGIDSDKEFEKYLLNKYVTYIDQNAYNNDYKAKTLHSSRRYIFISLFTILIAFVPFIYNIFKQPEKTYNIKFETQDLINERLLKLEENAKPTKSTNSTASSATTRQNDKRR